jgi:hypothetical protein
MQTSKLWVTKNERIMLRLSPERTSIEIGWFTDRRNTFHCQRRSNHIFGDPPSLGFNYQLLNEYDFARVVVHLQEGKDLLTTPLQIREKGELRKGWKKGFELQYILPVSQFGMEKARETEKKVDDLADTFIHLCQSMQIKGEVGRFATSHSLKKAIKELEDKMLSP